MYMELSCCSALRSRTCSGSSSSNISCATKLTIDKCVFLFYNLKATGRIYVGVVAVKNIVGAVYGVPSFFRLESR